MPNRNHNSKHQKKRRVRTLTFSRLEPRQLLAAQPISFAQSIVQSYYFAPTNLNLHTHESETDNSKSSCVHQNDGSEETDCASFAITLSNFHFDLFQVSGQRAGSGTTVGRGDPSYSNSTPQARPNSTQNNTQRAIENQTTAPPAVMPSSNGNEGLTPSPVAADDSAAAANSNLEPVSMLASDLSALDAAYGALPLEVDHESYFRESENDFDSKSFEYARTGLLDQYQAFSLIDFELAETRQLMGESEKFLPLPNAQTSLKHLIANVESENPQSEHSKSNKMDFNFAEPQALLFHQPTCADAMKNANTDLPDATTVTQVVTRFLTKVKDRDELRTWIDDEIQEISVDSIPLGESALIAAILGTNIRQRPERDDRVF